jgi:hypothetical protein
LRKWLKQKGTLFLGKLIITLLPVVHIKLLPLCMPNPITSTLSPSNLLLLLFTTRCVVPVSHSMAEETAHDLPIADKATDGDAQSDSGTESAAPTSSSPTKRSIERTRSSILFLAFLLKHHPRIG